MTVRLSVNLNKFALVRNSRGQNTPDICQIAQTVLALGAAGVTVHPRPDHRHITPQDVIDLNRVVETFKSGVELNVEGYPSDDFIRLVCQVKPHQVTLVPDPPDALTSSFGWDVASEFDFLQSVSARLKSVGIRVSVFIDPVMQDVAMLKKIGVDRVELYTYDYAHGGLIAPYVAVATQLKAAGIGLNAGHDLNLENLSYFIQTIPGLLEVSIGHALVCDSFEMGMSVAVKRYLDAVQ